MSAAPDTILKEPDPSLNIFMLTQTRNHLTD